MRPLARLTTLALMLSLGWAGMTPRAARAQDSPPVATTLTIEPLPPIEAGKPVIIAAQLNTVGGDRTGALNNEGLELFIDGVRERRALTDPSGKVAFRLQRELPPGTYQIEIVYGGSRALQPSNASATLTITPAPAIDPAANLPVTTTLTIEPLQPIRAGRPITIVARLDLVGSERTGALNNESIELLIDGVRERRALTDPAGKVSFRLQRDLPPGTYHIQIVYRGSRLLLASQAAATLTIYPAPAIDPTARLPVTTTLTIERPQPVEIGRPVTIDARLGVVGGDRAGALDNEVIDLFIDGEHERRARTDPAGKVSFRLQRELPPGSYDIQIEYPGSRALHASTARARLKIVPAEVSIQTVPSLPGMRFALDGRIFAADDRGLARIAVERPGSYRLEALDTESTGSNIQLKFARWMDEAFTASRAISVPLSRPLMVGFNVSYRVSQAFVDLEGRPFNPDRITSFTLRSSQGAVLDLKDGAERWLQASSVARRTTGLEATQIQYAVDSVMIDGSNVVNQAQQRFYVNADDVWEIQLLLYSMQISGRDALFGFPIGSGLRLEYPDGRVEPVPFTSNAEVTVEALVRGIYRVGVIGAPGLAPISPVALSRNQNVDLLVISYLDLAIALGLAAILGIGLVVVGRPQLLPAIYRQLGAVRNVTWARVRARTRGRARVRTHGRRSVRPEPALVHATNIPVDHPPPSRSRLDHTVLLAVAFISIGSLAGGLGALRAAAIQAKSTPTADPSPAGTRLPDVSLTSTPTRVPTASGAPLPDPTTATPTPVPTASGTPLPDPTTATPTRAPDDPATQPPKQQLMPTPTPDKSTPTPDKSTPIPDESTPVPAGSSPAAIELVSARRILRIGSVGLDVASLQRRLRQLGYFASPRDTGYFGGDTYRAVVAFQVDHCLPETGIVNANVVRALNRGVPCAESNQSPEGILR